jgi:uncharacterized YigZ family protein
MDYSASHKLAEKIKTVTAAHQAILKEKSSEFIVFVFPVENEESALQELKILRKKYFDATHHCFAFKLIDGQTKYSDDGEPKGTAGIRILNAIEHFELSNILIVVIRYFGGTKLGVGSLGKAYYNSSLKVLEEANMIELFLYQFVEIKTAFEQINHVHRVINNCDAVIVNSDFSNDAKFDCLIKPSIIEKVTSELVNLSNGKIKVSAKPKFDYK